MKIIQAVTEKSNQEAFLFAYAKGRVSGHYTPNLLMAVIGGADSAVQSIKAVIESGRGVYIGNAKKQEYRYTIELAEYVATEKGGYRTFVSRTKEGYPYIIMVSKSVISGEVMLAQEENVKAQWRGILQRKFGTPCLEEWDEQIWEASQPYLEKIEAYSDPTFFPTFVGYTYTMTEERADQTVSELVKKKKVAFPVEGSGKKIEEYEGLAHYMLNTAKLMAEKVAKQISVVYDPAVMKHDSYLDTLATPLYPMQAHVVSACTMILNKQKTLLLEGEMSTGKTKMGTAVAHLLHKGKKGYFALVACPPTLTHKWAEEEIHSLLPHAKTIWVDDTKTLIRWHQDWIRKGKPEPETPTFFIIGWTTLRNGPKIDAAIPFQHKEVRDRDGKKISYRCGYYCPRCGQPHTEKDGSVMLAFGSTRRKEDGKSSQNNHCRHCGERFWSATVIQRLKMKEWFRYSRVIEKYARQGDYHTIAELQKSLGEYPSSNDCPRRVAAIEYIMRKMKGFFEIAIVDEIHELKGGTTAQGNALGGLVSACKKVLGMTGTLFGGYASNLFYLLWRLFPAVMKQSGIAYTNLEQWVREYGNYVKTEKHEEIGLKTSRGKKTSVVTKEAPGISTFVFSRYLMPNMVSVRLSDLGIQMPEKVEIPPILVEMDPELKDGYMHLKNSFENGMNDEGGKRIIGGYLANAMSYPDKPYDQKSYYNPLTGNLVWVPRNLDPDKIYNKERKLQEIIQAEINEGRKAIIFVRDSQERDIQPRLKWVVEQVPGVKAEILRSNTTKTNMRTQWVKSKAEQGVNVFIANAELVKVGLDLIMLPTQIYYQIPWSLYTIRQASRRAWRINQTQECRNYYLVYKDTFQEYCASLMAKKELAAKALNGDVSPDGLAAMVGGDSGDLRAMLIEAIKLGKPMQSSREAYVLMESRRTREIIAAIDQQRNKRAKANIVIVGDDQLAFDFGFGA